MYSQKLISLLLFAILALTGFAAPTPAIDDALKLVRREISSQAVKRDAYVIEPKDGYRWSNKREPAPGGYRGNNKRTPEAGGYRGNNKREAEAGGYRGNNKRAPQPAAVAGGYRGNNRREAGGYRGNN